MPFPLPAYEASRIYGHRQVGLQSRVLSRHQKIAVVGSGIVESCDLNGVVERVGPAEFAECLVFDGFKDFGVDCETPTPREVQHEDWKDVVMTRNAGSLCDEFLSRTLHDRKRSIDSFANVGLRLCPGGRLEQQGYENCMQYPERTTPLLSQEGCLRAIASRGGSPAELLQECGFGTTPPRLI